MTAKEFKIWFKENTDEIGTPNLTLLDAFRVLTDHFLGENYMIIDPVGGEQANAIIVQEILEKYPITDWTKRFKKAWKYLRGIDNV